MLVFLFSKIAVVDMHGNQELMMFWYVCTC